MTVSVTDQIRVLCDLQKIDSRIYQMQMELKRFPEELKKVQSFLDQSKKNFEEQDQLHKAVHIRLKEQENEVLTNEELIKKLQSQQAKVKTNQEYSVLTQEIQYATADKSLAEEKVLKLFDEVDAQKKKFEESRAQHEKDKEGCRQKTDEIIGRQKSIEADIAALRIDRKKYTPSIDLELLERYEMIIQKRNGLAVVPRRQEACGGCGFRFPPQVINEVQMRDHIVYCENCGRLVYEEDSPEPASAP